MMLRSLPASNRVGAGPVKALARERNPLPKHERFNLTRSSPPSSGPNLSATSQCAHDFSRISVFPPPAGRIQAKLFVSAPVDIYEQEADAVAEQAMGMSAAAVSEVRRTDLLLQRQPSGDAELQDAPPLVGEVLRSPGHPLDPAARAFMEPRFGVDFSGITVHSDAKAAGSAHAVRARTYTVGSHIVFGAHEYSPQSDTGLRLLAHELTHSIQQGTAQPSLQRKPVKSPTPPPPPAGGNILYVGLNNFPLEIAALKKLYKGKPVSIKEVTLTSDPAHTVSGRGTFDLTSDAGLTSFVATLGLDKPHTASAVALLRGISQLEDRDDTAHVMAVYALTESDGVDRMSRVVLSGHSFGSDIVDAKFISHIQFAYLRDMAKIFPKAAAQTKHLYVTACYAGAEDNVRDYFRSAYPNLITFSGWTDQCPTDKSGAAAVSAWAKTTDPDPTSLAKPPEGRSNWASGVYQGAESSAPSETMKNLREDEATFMAYFDGVKVDRDAHRGWLTTYYGQARTADLRVSSIKGADHDFAHVRAEQAVRLRLWTEFVAKFWKDYETKIRAGYGKVTSPDFGKMTRKQALKAIEDFPRVARGAAADVAEAQRLLDGLKTLDEKVLPG
jgi:hypothetical protein